MTWVISTWWHDMPRPKCDPLNDRNDDVTWRKLNVYQIQWLADLLVIKFECYWTWGFSFKFPNLSNPFLAWHFTQQMWREPVVCRPRHIGHSWWLALCSSAHRGGRQPGSLRWSYLSYRVNIHVHARAGGETHFIDIRDSVSSRHLEASNKEELYFSSRVLFTLCNIRYTILLCGVDGRIYSNTIMPQAVLHCSYNLKLAPSIGSFIEAVFLLFHTMTPEQRNLLQQLSSLGVVHEAKFSSF